MISFEPTEDQKLMVESVATFARNTLRPKIREFESERGLPEVVRKTAHELGLGLVALPDAVGGAGLGMMTAALLEEEVAFEKLGLPELDDQPVAELSETIQRGVYAGFVAPAALYAALAFVVVRNRKQGSHEEEER